MKCNIKDTKNTLFKTKLDNERGNVKQKTTKAIISPKKTLP